MIYQKENEALEHAVELLSLTNKRLEVKYEYRKAFLTPFVPLLVGNARTHGMRGVRALARVLHLLVDFMDADGGKNTLNVKCIEDELYKLRNELYPMQ